MTVGIGAAYNGENPAVVLIADRMVTTGTVEHEHSNGKLEKVSPGNPAVAAVAAGTLSYADELYYRVGNRLLDEPTDTVQEVAELFVEEMHSIIGDEANDRILSDYELTLNQITNDGVALGDELVRDLLAQVTEIKNEIQGSTNMLFAGVDDNHGAQILELRQGSLTRHRSLGYQCIGSGHRSARLTFMRNEYDPENLEDALMLAADAKNQASEAQGVGDKMDIAVVEDGVTFLERGHTEEIQNVIEDVRDAERQARETTITDADLDTIR